MGNCLVTKLKGTVDNPNLPKLGEFRIEIGVKPNVTAPFWVFGQGVMKITVEGDGHFYKGTYDNQTDVTTELNLINTRGYRISEGNSIIHITPKYGLTNITLNTNADDLHTKLNLDWSSLQFNSPGLSIIWVSQQSYDFDFDLDKVKFGALQFFEIITPNIHGDINNIAKAITYVPEGEYSSYNTISIGEGATDNKPLGGSIEGFIRAITPAGYGFPYIHFRPCGPTFHGVLQNYTFDIVLDAQGNATITRVLDSKVVATYNRANDEFTYVEE